MKNTTVTSNLLFPVTTLYTTSLTLLSYSTASITLPIPLSAANRLSCSAISVSDGFPGWKLTLKFKTDGPELPATDARNRSLCCTNSVRIHCFDLTEIFTCEVYFIIICFSNCYTVILQCKNVLVISTPVLYLIGTSIFSTHIYCHYTEK